MGNWNWDHMGSGMGWGFGYGGIGMILFWVVIIAAVVILAKGLTGGTGQSDKPAAKTALDILKERYASGEIDREEFERKKREID